MSGEDSQTVDSPQVSSDADGKNPLSQERIQELYNLPLVPIATYLRQNCKTSWGATDEKRVEYFKGLAAVKCLIRSEKWGIKRKSEAIIVLERLLEHKEYFHQATKEKKPSGGERMVPIRPEKQVFALDQSRYIWTFESASWTNTILGIILVIFVFAGCLFPIWPAPMRDGVWYLSMGSLGLVGLFFVVCILRVLLLAMVWIATGGTVYLWWYPNLLRDDDKFWASFIPFYSISIKGNAVKPKDQ